MKLSEAAKIFEDCMKTKEVTKDCGLCPLLKEMAIKFGDVHDTSGQMTWRLQGCSAMDLFSQWLKNKKPVKMVDFEKTEGKNVTERSG